MSSSTRSMAHVLSVLFSLCESVHTQDLPGASFKILVMIKHHTCELASLECFENSVCLTERIRLPEVDRYLQRDL